MAVRPLSELTPQPFKWLWLYRLAVGKLSILDGDPGQGKSMITLDLCARLSRGLPFSGRLTESGASQLAHPHRRGRGQPGPAPTAAACSRSITRTGPHRKSCRGSGHIGFQSVCRTSWLVADNPGVPGQHVLAPVKNNRAAPQPSLAFTFESANGSAPSLRWLGTTTLERRPARHQLPRPRAPGP
jgi:hypothetical protein